MVYNVKDWSTATTMLIYKRADPAHPRSYQPIALISHMPRVVDSTIAFIVQRIYTFCYFY